MCIESDFFNINVVLLVLHPKVHCKTEHGKTPNFFHPIFTSLQMITVLVTVVTFVLYLSF